ncbi:2OG-Fe(II) oxygenase [Kordiimonas sp.]|uniref:2OG-Fe(II) oxygenase n=1 Tax=Kordiimonas sp. TaxID=1970157 RepID=UPI003A904109
MHDAINTNMTGLTARASSGDPAAMLELGQINDSAGNPSEALSWVRKAADTGWQPAMLQMAVWAIAGRHVQKDESGGAQIIIAIAKTGHSVAGRLAVNLYASGTGVEQSWNKATGWLCRLAKAGDANALMQLAVMLRPHPRLASLRHTLLFSAAQSDQPCAKYLLGAALLSEQRPDDHAAGLGWIAAAANDGYRLAQTRLEQFAGETMRRARPPVLAPKVPWWDMKRLIILPHEGPLSKKRSVSQSPSVYVQRGFLSCLLCDYMIGAGSPHLTAATVHDAQAGEIVDGTRTNSFANFRLLEADLVTLSVSARMMRAMGQPIDHGDPLSFLQYETGQSYAPHYDFFDPTFPAHRPHLQDGGQRIQTGLLYLNDDYQAGATCFHHTDFRFNGERGSFLQFTNVDDAGEGDMASLHSGEPPTAGTKWILSKWAREAHRPL